MESLTSILGLVTRNYMHALTEMKSMEVNGTVTVNTECRARCIQESRLQIGSSKSNLSPGTR